MSLGTRAFGTCFQTFGATWWPQARDPTWRAECFTRKIRVRRGGPNMRLARARGARLFTCPLPQGGGTQLGSPSSLHEKYVRGGGVPTCAWRVRAGHAFSRVHGPQGTQLGAQDSSHVKYVRGGGGQHAPGACARGTYFHVSTAPRGGPKMRLARVRGTNFHVSTAPRRGPNLGRRILYA